MSSPFRDDEVPYFCWDRSWTVQQIRAALRSAQGSERTRLVSWILREAAVADVWQFLNPREVWGQLDALEPQLGRRRAFWRYIFNTWHELGRV
jgi:hypothetical protein